MAITVTYRGNFRQLEQAQPACDEADIIRRIMKSDAKTLDQFSAAIQERRFSLGIGKFSKALIYLVRAIDTGVVAYVGSTSRSMKVRWAGHESFFKTNPFSKWTMYVLEHGGPGNFRIELIEEYPCRSFQELLEREKHFIHLLEPVCNIAMRAGADEPEQVLDGFDSFLIDSDELKRSARKYISPAASFRDNCPSYDCLQDISSDVCRKILDNNKLKKSSELEVLTACKYIFDNYIVESRTELDHRGSVFDRAMRNKQSRCVLINTTLWKDKRRITVLDEIYGSENPFKPSYEDIDGVLSLAGQVTQELGLRSFWDSGTMFTSTVLGEKLIVLQTIVNNLIELMQLPRSTAKEPIKALSGCLHTVFRYFSAYCLISDRTRPCLPDGKRPSVYVYHICPDEKDKTFLESMFKII